MTEKRVWLLGNPDPEMERIERLLLSCRERVMHRSKVSGSLAAELSHLLVYAVECRPDGLDILNTVIIDHHAEGDFGFGRPPADFMWASSLGQVICVLAKLGKLAGWEKAEEPRNKEQPSVTVAGVARKIPKDLVLAAASDHCCGAAYRGECPGVRPGELMGWRAGVRAKFQGVSEAHIIARVTLAQKELVKAPTLQLAPQVVCADMRRPEPVPELPEAAMRLSVGYVSGPLIGQDGRRKFTCSGTSEQIEAFLATWAPKNGLKDLYGDPARGFAGGYEI